MLEEIKLKIHKNNKTLKTSYFHSSKIFKLEEVCDERKN